MKKIVLIFFLLFFPLTAAFCANLPESPVTIDGDTVEYQQGTGKVFAKGNVKIHFQDIRITCDEADYDAATSLAQLRGHIYITGISLTPGAKPGEKAKVPKPEKSSQSGKSGKSGRSGGLKGVIKGPGIAYGDHAVYDFNKKCMVMEKTRIEMKPLFVEAVTVTRPDDTKFIFNNAWFTTCNLEKPHYRFAAKHVTVYPKKKIIAHNVVFYVLDVPVFYFPYMVMPANDKASPFEASYGTGSEWGTHLLTRWRYHFGDDDRGRWILDNYQRRGVGMGVTNMLETKDFGELLSTYYRLQDNLYNIKDRPDFFKQYPERVGMDDKYLDGNRYKGDIAYNWQPNQNLSFVSEFNKSSDQFFIKDFFRREYDAVPEALTYGLATYSFGRSSLSLLAQDRVNHFYSETEYLPQLSYNVYRQSIASTNFYFQSQTSLGSIDYRTAYTGVKYSTDRAYSNNILSYVQNVGFVKIVPYVGENSTYYSRGLNAGDTDLYRAAFEDGVAVSTKFYKPFDFRMNMLGEEIEQMRHVLTPEIDYSFIHTPTIDQSRLFQFDSLDALARTENVTVTLANKLQAKAGAHTWDFLYFAPSAVYDLNHDGKGNHWDAFSSNLEFYPHANMSIRSDAVYGFPEKHFRTANVDICYSDPKSSRYSIVMGERYAYKTNYPQDTFDFTYQLTPKFSFHGAAVYECHVREFQDILFNLRTDLHCWWLDTGFEIDSSHNKVIRITFTLKDFPDLHFGGYQKYNPTPKNEY
jgi:hypothetical protein